MTWFIDNRKFKSTPKTPIIKKAFMYFDYIL